LETYRIVRFYAPSSKRGFDGLPITTPKQTIKQGLTEAEAREHCQRDDTRGNGWFDGYEKET
jgi:hypothetical protein